MAENTYYDYINAFYDLLQVNPITSNAQLLYHTLLMIFNKAHWVDELQRTNYSICGLCGIGEKALTTAKNELKQLGLIDFVSPKKKPTIYRLCTVKMTGQTQVKGKSNASQTQVKGQTYKDKRRNTEDIINTTPIVPVQQEDALEPSPDFKKVSAAYEKNMGMLSPVISESIADWLNDVDADMIIWAISETVKQGKHAWKYTEAILNNHFNAGRITLAAVQEAQRNFKRPDADLSINKDDNLDYDELEKIMQEKM